MLSHKVDLQDGVHSQQLSMINLLLQRVDVEV